jgi:hypothetical protein
VPRARAAVHPLVDAVLPVVKALGGEVVDASTMEPSDIPLAWDGEVVAAVRPPDLHGALVRQIQMVERELGAPLADLGREDKQRAVHLLDSRGAFQLRKSIETVAELLGVSRFTVYNYLNRPEA